MNLDASPVRRGRVIVVFRSALGFIYLAAFLSLAVQLVDLAGSRGLLPLTEYLERLRAATPGWIERLHSFPTILWLEPSDAALLWVPLAGAAAALALIAGTGGRFIPVLLWGLYLSCITAGRDFFYYQWDNLLVETGFLAIFLPVRGSILSLARRRPIPEPHPVMVFLLRWLLFRLLFESGMAKILFGWDDWFVVNGMTLYYETAPLPSLGGWVIQQLPIWFHTFSICFTIAVELALPFFIFLGRRFRIAFFLIHLPFQASIALTSNYGFFNLLSVVLSLSVLEDRDLDAVLAWFRRRLRRKAPPVGEPPSTWPRLIHPAGWPKVLHTAGPWVLAGLLIPASIVEGLNYFVRSEGFSGALSALRGSYSPLRSVNRYHLFPGVVRQRVVAEIQGTRNGVDWAPYRLRYAPGDPRVAPPMTWLHNPRFPFHYSFYTLGRGQRDREYINNLATRLCCDPPAVSRLFEADPFAGERPTALRLVYYRYRFSTRDERSRIGIYWTREEVTRPTRALVCRCPGSG